MYQRVIFLSNSKSVYEVDTDGIIYKNGLVYNLKEDYHGYLRFGRLLVHRIVAQNFIPNPDDKPCVDHIDTNKKNNNVTNLRWVTYSENMLNPLTVALNVSKQTWQKGKNNPMYGRKRPPEWCQHQSEIMTGKHLTMPDRGPEWRKHISESKKGKKLSPESLAARREKMQNKKNNKI